MSNGWRQVAGVVESTSGRPVPDCHVWLIPLTPNVEVLEVAVFSDEEGRWSHMVRADAAFEIIGAMRPGHISGRTHVAAGRTSLLDLVLTVEGPI